MRKTLLALTLLSTTVLSAAEYSIKAPLESTEGGSLPNGSIKFTNQQPTAPTEIWVAATPIYTDWVNDGNPFNCTNWSPDPSTVTIGQTFTQTATDCEQQQTRTRQDREQETTTLAFRDVGFPVYESQTITTTDTRESVGILETWIATTPTYTDWVNSGEIYGCSNWSPDPSTITNGQPFTQTATDCKQDQTRYRQDREQESNTLAIRNKGTAVTESQTITVSSTRTAIGTKVTLTCKYTLANPGYAWEVSKYDTQAVIWWVSTVMTTSKSSTTYTHSDGTKYQRGNLMVNNSGGQIYEICKVN